MVQLGIDGMSDSFNPQNQCVIQLIKNLRNQILGWLEQFNEYYHFYLKKKTKRASFQSWEFFSSTFL